MAYVDFVNDCTEVDPDGELTVTTNKIEVTGINVDGDNRVYKDGGVNHYDDAITHQFELTITNSNSNFEFIWALGDVATGWSDFSNDCMGCSLTDPEGVGDFLFILMTRDFEKMDIGTVDLNFNTKYYVTVERTSAPLTKITIRTGSHGGNIVDTIQIVDAGNSYRYLYQAAELSF